jgi:hypothetical protein
LCAGLFFLSLINGADGASFAKLKIQPLVWPEKRSSFFTLKIHFQLIFDSKHLENTVWTLLNQSMISENTHTKKDLKPKINLKLKNLLKSRSYFRCFQGKKKKHLIITASYGSI